MFVLTNSIAHLSVPTLTSVAITCYKILEGNGLNYHQGKLARLEWTRDELRQDQLIGLNEANGTTFYSLNENSFDLIQFMRS